MRNGSMRVRTMNEKPISTFDRIMKDQKRRFKFEQEYRKFILVDILIPLLEKSKISVRALAHAAGVSPTIIQDIKSGKKEGISFPTFMSILEALGYSATIRVDKERRSTRKRSQTRSHIQRRKKTTV